VTIDSVTSLHSMYSSSSSSRNNQRQRFTLCLFNVFTFAQLKRYRSLSAPTTCLHFACRDVTDGLYAPLAKTFKRQLKTFLFFNKHINRRNVCAVLRPIFCVVLFCRLQILRFLTFNFFSVTSIFFRANRWSVLSSADLTMNCELEL